MQDAVALPMRSPAVEAAALPVRAALTVFLRAVQQAALLARQEAEADPERDRRRRVVLVHLQRNLDSVQVDTIATFERVLNGCLALGYRAKPLAAFVYAVLEPRLARRVRRRLAGGGAFPSPEDVADVVAATVETLARLIRDANRTEYSLRYALLLSVADHRAIDHLRARRRRPELVGLPEGETAELVEFDPWGREAGQSPESQLVDGQRVALAETVRGAVFEAVNTLPPRERAALIAVDLHGISYPDVARTLDLSPMDVGNVVRRARRLRDRALIPHLRTLPGLGGHVGFTEMQADKELRLHILRWAVDIGEGVCSGCARHAGHLHDARQACPDPS